MPASPRPPPLNERLVLHKTLYVNLLGVTLSLLPRCGRWAGCVVSVSGVVGWVNPGSYFTSKWGLETFPDPQVRA